MAAVQDKKQTLKIRPHMRTHKIFSEQFNSILLIEKKYTYSHPP